MSVDAACTEDCKSIRQASKNSKSKLNVLQTKMLKEILLQRKQKIPPALINGIRERRENSLIELQVSEIQTVLRYEIQ
eukprot:751717-Hanusia_phi.AAC.1